MWLFTITFPNCRAMGGHFETREEMVDFITTHFKKWNNDNLTSIKIWYEGEDNE